MAWTPARRLEAAIAAPLSCALPCDDTREIVRPGWHQVVTPSSPGTTRNEIALSVVDEADAERVIDEAIATYRALGKPVKWCVGPWTRPADFGERLARRGFRAWGVSGMGIATDVRPKGGEGLGLRVREVASASELDEWLETSLRGWDVPREHLEAERRSHAAALAASPRVVHLFSAEGDDGACVGTAGLVLRGDYAYLVATQVLAAARGRGAYRALVAARLAFLRERGIGYAVTHARDATSAPILERLGFERLFRSQCWLLDP